MTSNFLDIYFPIDMCDTCLRVVWDPIHSRKTGQDWCAACLLLVYNLSDFDYTSFMSKSILEDMLK